jgi:hypothetical protein
MFFGFESTFSWPMIPLNSIVYKFGRSNTSYIRIVTHAIAQLGAANLKSLAFRIR